MPTFNLAVSGFAGAYGYTADALPAVGDVIKPDGTEMRVEVEEVHPGPPGEGAIFAAVVIESRAMTTTVNSWSEDEGWGALAMPDAPDGIFVHFSAIEMEGYKLLTPGQKVEALVFGPLPYEPEDGYRYEARSVRPLT